MGNRLHLAFKRQVPTEQAQAFAERLGVTFFEVSSLCNFNITESFTELARTVLLRHGMDRLWRPSKGGHHWLLAGLQDALETTGPILGASVLSWREIIITAHEAFPKSACAELKALVNWASVDVRHGAGWGRRTGPPRGVLPGDLHAHGFGKSTSH